MDNITSNLGWVAGFFQGEGSAVFNKRNGQLSLAIRQVAREPLDRVCVITGAGKVYGPWANNRLDHAYNHRPIFQWSTTNSKQAKELAEQLIPLLSEPKVSQVQLAIDRWESRPFKRYRNGVVPRIPNCHPDRKHEAGGLCTRCYSAAAARKRYSIVKGTS